MHWEFTSKGNTAQKASLGCILHLLACLCCSLAAGCLLSHSPAALQWRPPVVAVLRPDVPVVKDLYHWDGRGGRGGSSGFVVKPQAPCTMSMGKWRHALPALLGRATTRYLSLSFRQSLPGGRAPRWQLQLCRSCGVTGPSRWAWLYNLTRMRGCGQMQHSLSARRLLLTHMLTSSAAGGTPGNWSHLVVLAECQACEH